MNYQIAQNALAFLERCQIAGKEVPAFVEVMQALSAIAKPPAPEPEDRA